MNTNEHALLLDPTQNGNWDYQDSSSLRDSARRSLSSQDTRRSSYSIIDATATFEGTATISSEVASVAKNLIGSGVLSLSGGIALYSNDTRSIFVAGFMIVMLGAMFGYFCLLMAKVCQMTNAISYRECWESTMGERGSMLVASISILAPAQGDLAYATVLSYTLKSLLETFGIRWSRVQSLLVLTIFVLLPLCLMKNLDALAPFSTLGVVSVGIAMTAMLIRCFDGSYEPGGIYHDDLKHDFLPSFGNESFAFTRRMLPFLCMVFQSWVMHYNTPRFYTELKDASIPRFAQVVGYSFGLTSAMYICIAAAGFWTFGGNSRSYILNNYSPNDPLATLSRMGVFVSTLLIYPLAFIGVRDACLDVFRVPQYVQTTTFLNIFSISVLTVLTMFAMLFDDLGLINAIGGGGFATFLCFVLPALMYREAVKQLRNPTPGQVKEVQISMTLMILGVVLGLVGVYQSIYEALQKK